MIGSARRTLLACCLILAGVAPAAAQQQPQFSAEFVFPLRQEHNHAPGIVECPNGDLLVSWYRGSGERSADDVAVYGARKKSGQAEWSPDFLMADFPNFPDCNTAMMIDAHERLWLFWPVIIANSWESCITNFLVSKDYQGNGSPKWDYHGLVLIKPDDFSAEFNAEIDKLLSSRTVPLSDRLAAGVQQWRSRADEKMYQRMGWQPRCKPTVLPSGRILFPLYTDTFSISIMAISDDGGRTWFASKPLIGLGNIQPAVLRRDDGTLLAYMRENGPRRKIRVCESKDDGVTWGPVYDSELPNPGSGLDGVRLANGKWVLIYNDTIQGRNKLAVSLSDDEGKTWKWTRHLEDQKSGSYHYPAIIQGGDGTIHAVYSYFTREGDKEGKSMKHAAFNEAWLVEGDKPAE